MEVVMIIVSLALLVTIAYKGFSVILFAPVCALVAASMAEYHLLPAYTDLFMGKAVVFVKSFFPIFLLGAVFGKVMEETGMARSIAEFVIQKLGKDKAIVRHDGVHHFGIWRRQRIRCRICHLSFCRVRL